MASRFSYKNDTDEDKRASPEETARQLSEQEQQSGYDRDFAALTDPEHLAKDGEEGDLGAAEDKGSWEDKTSGQQSPKGSRVQRVFAFAKKRSALLTLVGLVGLGGAGAATVLGPAGMIVNLMENFSITNDSSSTSLERRFMRLFGNMTSGDPVCANSTKTIKCRMGRISNRALTQLAKKGVTAYFDDNSGVDKKTGYPKKNPKGYTIDLGSGKTANINAADLPGFLAKKENAKIAAKILGRGGAFNLRLKAWSGKYLTKKFLTKFGLEKKGGLANGENAKSKYSDVLGKLRKKIPGLDRLSSVGAGVKAKVETHLGSAKKGGTGYVLAVAGCIAVKAPGYIAAGVAAIQMAQILPIVMDVVLSPGSKLKASGVDPASAIDPTDVSAIGGLLTTQTARASDGKMTSALDSPYLQSAMGVNTNKLPVSTKYTPGYSVLTSPLVLSANEAAKASAPACNAIMSPAAMYTAMAVDAAVTVAASTTVIGGLIKIAAGFAISAIVVEVVKNVAGDAAIGVVTDLAQNDEIPKAEGEGLGDVIGISASSFFAGGGMVRNLPALSADQVPQFAALQKENEAFNRDMDIASLSPLDTSSRYTFMGSIVYNMHMAAFASGSYSGSIFSFFTTAAQLPLRSLSVLSGTANAASGFSNSSCGYAKDFGLEAINPALTPAINQAGMPCTGLTDKMASMSTAKAITLVQDEGWLDENVDIAEDATIDDLMSSGYIRGDTPLSDYIKSCGDPSTGDYLFNAAGCVIDTTSKDPNTISQTIDAREGSCDDDGCITDSEEVGEATGGLQNADSMAAMPVFLVDYQMAQMVNGEDEIEGEGPEEPVSTSTDSAFYDASESADPTEVVSTPTLEMVSAPTTQQTLSLAITNATSNELVNGYALASSNKQRMGTSRSWVVIG